MKLQALLFVAIISIISCTFEKSELGSKNNPIKLFFVPSVDAKLISSRAKDVERYLEEKTGKEFEIKIPASYVAVVEAFGTKRADVAALNTFGYILANEKYGTEAWITLIRYGNASYKSQIIARKDSGIENVKDIHDKKVAFVDPASTSGYLLPAKKFIDNQVKPKESVFAKKHDNVVTMVYQGQVDAGATFHSPAHKGDIQDARRLVRTQYPDVEEKIKIVELSDEIPNDPIVFRKGMDSKLKKDIQSALLEYVKTEEGKKAFHDLYGANDFRAAKDSDYDSVREMLAALGKSASDLMKK